MFIICVLFEIYIGIVEIHIFTCEIHNKWCLHIIVLLYLVFPSSHSVMNALKESVLEILHHSFPCLFYVYLHIGWLRHQERSPFDLVTWTLFKNKRCSKKLHCLFKNLCLLFKRRKTQSFFKKCILCSNLTISEENYIFQKRVHAYKQLEFFGRALTIHTTFQHLHLHLPLIPSLTGILYDRVLPKFRNLKLHSPSKIIFHVRRFLTDIRETKWQNMYNNEHAENIVFGFYVHCST